MESILSYPPWDYRVTRCSVLNGILQVLNKVSSMVPFYLEVTWKYYLTRPFRKRYLRDSHVSFECGAWLLQERECCDTDTNSAITNTLWQKESFPSWNYQRKKWWLKSIFGTFHATEFYTLDSINPKLLHEINLQKCKRLPKKRNQLLQHQLEIRDDRTAYTETYKSIYPDFYFSDLKTLGQK
jgi:hypothetical protein